MLAEDNETDLRPPEETAQQPLPSSPSLPRHVAARNLQVLAWSFFLVFLAFGATQNLESSLHPGAAASSSLGVLYVVFTAASLRAPEIVERLGSTKKGISLGLATYVPFIVCNLQPRWWTLLPSAALLGAGAAALWNAQGVFLSVLSTTKEEASAASGTFFTIYQLGQLLGNLVAFFVLRSGDYQGQQADVSRAVEVVLFVIFSVSATAGVLLSLRLDNIDGSSYAAVRVSTNESNATRGSIDENGTSRLSDDSITLDMRPSAGEENLPPVPLGMMSVLWLDKTLLMLVPLFIYSGTQSAWIWNEFTGSVIKPSLGTEIVPMVMIFFCLGNAVFSWALGKFSGGTPRRRKALLVCGMATGMLIVSCGGVDVFADLQNDSKGLGIIIFTGVMLGFADATCNTLITAILASRKSELDNRITQLSFAHFKVWQSLAIALLFFVSAHLRLATKSAVTTGIGVVSISLLFATTDL
ncbi:Protein unc-93-like A [Hondaea fermentalgiana]|uniref:Protein unc-93-like A n=1 Tax=Hondaea fermentalgiana TaxID=2315210 RepID=A0A2R5GII9_9STRA|nr:Protein unc-93-like A [Hondaea fermentalgiana]|eukprot:GBG30710.1 Protein unc-93-like A [Hondaea fermentalgiana]